MNSKQSVIGVLAAILLTVSMVGCESQLSKQAEINDRAALVAEQTATDIQAILDKYPAGSIEDGQLVDLIRGVIPESHTDQFNRLVAMGSDVRATAEILADELPEVAQTLREEAESIRAKAASDDSDWNKGLAAVTSAAKSFGGVIGLIGGIAGVWFKRGRDKSNYAMRDLVSSIEAAKASSTEMNSAFANNGGAAMRASLSPDTQAIIKAIRETM